MAKTKKAIKRRRKKTKKSIKRKKKLKSGTTRKLSKSLKKAKSKSKKRKTNGGKMSAEMKLSSVLDTSHLKVKFPFKAKYGNYINGKFVEPKSGKYFDNTSPISNEKICAVARSNEKDVDAALDAAHAAFPSWGKTSITERSNMLLKVADAIEKNLNFTWVTRPMAGRLRCSSKYYAKKLLMKKYRFPIKKELESQKFQEP